MAFDFRKFIKGIKLIPISGSTSGAGEKGDLDVTDGNGKLNYHNGTSASPVVTEAHSATLTNKTIDGDDNTIQDVGISSLKTVAGDANKVIRRDGSGAVVSGNSIPNTSGLITTDSSSTLTNKTLSDSTTSIADASDATKQIKFDAAGTTSTSTTITSSQTANRVLTLPDATDTLVGETKSATLTNKTIAAGSNTISGLTNSNLSGSAAISNANLATMASSSTTVGTVKGNISGSSATPSDVVLTSANTSSSAVYRDSSGNFSAGTITASLSGNATNVTGTVAIANGGTGQTTQTAAFDALAPTTTAGDLIVRGASNNVRVGVGSDGQVLVADSSQTNKLKWATVAKGTKNYITYGDFENGSATSGWSLAHSTLNSTTKVPNQPSGSWTSAAGTLTKTVVSSGQLAGTYSLSLASSGVTTAGDMLVTDALTLDLEAQASVQTFSFFYKVASGAANGDFSGTSSNSLGVAIYVVDGTLAGTWIQPAGAFNIIQSSGVGKASGTFQVPSDATQVRLAVYFPTATTGAITVYLDDFVLGPQAVQYGAPVTDWESYTVTVGSSVAPNPTPSGSAAAYYRRVGDSLEVQYDYQQSSIGSDGGASGIYYFPLPSGVVINTSVISTNTINSGELGRYVLGTASFRIGTTEYLGYVTAYSSTALRLVVQDSLTNPLSLSSFTSGYAGYANAAFRLSFFAKVPIQGWSSSVQMSNDTDTRVVAMINYSSAATGTVGSTFAASTDINFGAADYDTHGAFDGTTYTIPVSGYYSITATTQVASTGVSAGLQYTSIGLNGSTFSSVYLRIADTLNTNRMVTNSGAWYFKAGDLITVRAYATTTTPTLSSTATLIIQRISGPATIAASETVAARYNTSTTTISTTTTTAVMSNKIFDTHNAYSGTGDYTIPVSGKYLVSGSLAYSSATASSVGGRVALRFTKNNSTFAEPGYFAYQQTTTAIGPTVSGSATIDCVAGDVLRIAGVVNASVGGGSVALTGITTTYFDIVRIGN